MGASESLQSLCSHSLDLLLLLFFSLHLRVLRDRFEFEYQLDHLYCVTLDYVFHSMGLSCFSLGLSFFFLGSTHPFTLLTLTWCFGICSLIVLTFFIFFTYHGLDTSFFSWLTWFYFQPDFSLQKGERRVFTFTPFLRCSPLPPNHFSLLSLGWKWIRDILL